MNRFSIFFLVVLFSCASHRPQQSLAPDYVKEKVCSPEALAYFNKSTKLPTKRRYTDEEVRAYTLKLQTFVKDCHVEEMRRTGKPNSFNLCFVAGIDKKGYTEFFQFSTSEVTLTNEMNQCLADIKHKADFGQLKDVSIAQPFILHNKTSY